MELVTDIKLASFLLDKMINEEERLPYDDRKSLPLEHKVRISKTGEIYLKDKDRTVYSPFLMETYHKGIWYRIEIIDQTPAGNFKFGIVIKGKVDFYKRLADNFNRIGRLPQYRSQICDNVLSTDCTMNKIWNRGMGSLAVWRIDTERKRILINQCMYNSSDARHLKGLIENVPELKEYEVLGCSYGYPTYYNHSFGYSLPNTEYKKIEI